MKRYCVVIINTATHKEERNIDCGTSKSKAEKVERGVNINLADGYHTKIKTTSK